MIKIRYLLIMLMRDSIIKRIMIYLHDRVQIPFFFFLVSCWTIAISCQLFHQKPNWLWMNVYPLTPITTYLSRTIEPVAGVHWKAVGGSTSRQVWQWDGERRSYLRWPLIVFRHAKLQLVSQSRAIITRAWVHETPSLTYNKQAIHQEFFDWMVATGHFPTKPAKSPGTEMTFTWFNNHWKNKPWLAMVLCAWTNWLQLATA